MAEETKAKLVTTNVSHKIGKRKKPWRSKIRSRAPRYCDDTLTPFDPYFNLDVGSDWQTCFHGKKVKFQEKKPETFYHIVNLDSYEYHKLIFNGFLSDILQSGLFRFVILCLVLLNAVLIGLNTSSEIGDSWHDYFHTVDQIILTFFIFEILLKWMYDFLLFWKVMWNVLDFIIVSFVVVTALIPPGLLPGHNTFVTVRVIRAFRSLRSVSSIASLSIVTHTVQKSIIDMANILLVLLLFMLVLAVMGVTLFDIEGLDSELFLNAFSAWVVLFICVTQDGWNNVLEGFRNQAYFEVVCVYMMFAVVVGAFVFANLIVAVVVANLELSVRELREGKQLNENPLEFQGKFSVSELAILPTYDVFASNNVPLRTQRPMTIPVFRSISARRLQAYIMLVVALEQNILESEIISADLQKVMGVELAIVKRMQKLTPTNIEEEGNNIEDLKHY